MEAGQSFLEKPMEMPFVPSWNRVQSALPDILKRLYQAVEDDMKEYSA
jgi:glucosyl-3-phosphoglycerate synthase